MSQDSFKYKLFSSDLDGDDFFMPDDRVWGKIDAVLQGDKKDRKPFAFILFSFLGIFAIVSFIFVGYQKDFGLAPISKSIQPFQNTTTILTTTSDSKQLATKETSIALHEKSESGNNPVQQNSTNVTVTENSNQSKRTVSSSQNNSKDWSIEKETSTTKRSSISKYSSSLNASALQGPILDYAQNDAGSYTHNQQVIDDEHQTSLAYSYQSSIPSNLQTSTPLINSSANQQINTSQNKLIGTPPSDALQLNITVLPTRLSSLVIDDAINSAYWNNKLTIVDKLTLKNARTWTFEVMAYTATSNYSIQDFSGFESIDFALTGDLSNGVQFMTKRQLSERVRIGIGIGLDNSHFNADYGIAINQDELNVDELGANYQAVISKNLPSLAGGLTTSFNLLGGTQNLKTNAIQLNLAHNYRTITAPVELQYVLMRSNRFDLNLGAGLLFSKRLLTIDTGVNQLEGNVGDELVELGGVAAADLTDQPFRIYNASTVMSVALDYTLTSAIRVGLQTRFARPLFSIYEDQNYTVSSQQYQVGLSLSYSLSRQ